MKHQSSEQIEFDLDPQPKSSPVIQESEPESVPSSSEKDYICPQCEIGGGSCPRHPRTDNPAHFIQKPQISALSNKELDSINAEMNLREQKQLPPMTPEEVRQFFKETKEELDELDKRRAS